MIYLMTFTLPPQLLVQNAMDVEYEHIVSEIKSAELNLTLLAVRPLMMLRKTSITGNPPYFTVGFLFPFCFFIICYYY